MPLDVPPPRGSRFGSPLVLSRVHWVRPELVAEVDFDHITGQRIRHGAKFKRWRPDKEPHECRLEQLRA